LSTLFRFPWLTDPSGGQRFSGTPSFGILSTYPPTPYGLATFSAALAHRLSTNGADVSVVRVSDGPPSPSTRVVGELVNGSAASVAACAELLNQSDLAVIQHEYGIYGGVDGDEVVGSSTDGGSHRSWSLTLFSKTLRHTSVRYSRRSQRGRTR
jgi:polysaccharide biosynthesis protein PslF